jgi:tetratricopeptide (TPR) repeat protein
MKYLSILILFFSIASFSQQFDQDKYRDSIRDFSFDRLIEIHKNIQLKSLLTKYLEKKRRNVNDSIRSSCLLRLADKSDLNDGLVHYQYGIIFLDAHKYDQAIEALSLAIDEKYDESFVFVMRGQAKKNNQDIFGAIKDFSTAIEKKTNTPSIDDAHFERGMCYAKLKKFEYALQDFDKAIELKPKIGKYHFYKGILLLQHNLKETGCLSLSEASNCGYSKAFDAIKKYCN